MVEITASSRYTPYAPVTLTTQFPVGFPIFDNSDVILLHEGEPVAFTVTASYVDGVSIDAVCVTSSGLVGEIEVVGSRAPRRTAQYANGAPLPIRDHNLALNRLAVENQEARRDVDRAWKSPFDFEGGEIHHGTPGKLVAFSERGLGEANLTAETIIGLVAAVPLVAADVEAAQSAAALSSRWADEEEDVPVEPGQYSAKHWAIKSQETASEVTSVNGKEGTVVLNADDVGAEPAGSAAAVSVLGRSGNTGGARADIAAGANDRILARVGNALAFVQITVGMITDSIITYAKLAAAAIATAAELRAGTASKLVDAATVHSSMAWAAITAGSAPAIDHAAGVNRTITHSANATMGAPSNAKPGMPLNIDITPGAFTTSWHGNYKFGASGAPSITARKVAHFMCRDSSTFVFLGLSDPT